MLSACFSSHQLFCVEHQWLSESSTQATLSLSPVAAERGSAASRLGLGVSQPRAGPASSFLRPEVSAKTLGVTPHSFLPLSLQHRPPCLAGSASSRVNYSTPHPPPPPAPRSRHLPLGASGPLLRDSASSRATPAMQRPELC